jgi:PTH1 family peptidyl-tRNA hydrolase
LKLIVGLGNPGDKYKNTRHNIGFEVLDKLAEDQLNSFGSAKGPYQMLKCNIHNQSTLLIKPDTYMNLSGKAVQHAMAYYKISIMDILVICDDFNLPLGSLRFRSGGSDGGQNGLKNIIQTIGRSDFSRLRLGISNTEFKSNASAFVLGKFKSEENMVVSELIDYAARSVISFIEHGLSKTMTDFNRKIVTP